MLTLGLKGLSKLITSLASVSEVPLKHLISVFLNYLAKA